MKTVIDLGQKYFFLPLTGLANGIPSVRCYVEHCLLRNTVPGGMRVAQPRDFHNFLDTIHKSMFSLGYFYEGGKKTTSLNASLAMEDDK